jgi:hypothetical protein
MNPGNQDKRRGQVLYYNKIWCILILSNKRFWAILNW